MTIKHVFFTLGLLLAILSVSLVPPLLVDLAFHNEDWKIFAFSLLVCAFFSGGLLFASPRKAFHPTIREAFLMNGIGWLVLCAFAALPFHFCSLDMTYTNAFFEAVSGLTTTGSTVINGLDTAPPGILMWRAMLQWIGGIGIIITALSTLPSLNIGGMQIFRAEHGDNEKNLPRMISLSLSLFVIYCGLTIACFLAYMAAGMGKFDALAHAMTTISTGGFSTHDASLGYFESNTIQSVATLFMLSGSLPFILYLKALKGRPQRLLLDSQVRTFLLILIFAIAVCTINLMLTQGMMLGEALRGASFNIVSLATGTGFTSENYNLWGGFIITLFFFLMAMGACAGSTSCGIKIFRFQILFAVIRVQFKKLLYPNGVFVAHYNRKPIPQGIPLAVLGFLFLYTLGFIGLSLALSLTGLDVMTALSGSITALSNVGPGIGDVIGPMGNFSTLPQAAKWLLSFGMLLGRLEIVAILVLCHPTFWRN